MSKASDGRMFMVWALVLMLLAGTLWPAWGQRSPERGGIDVSQFAGMWYVRETDEAKGAAINVLFHPGINGLVGFNRQGVLCHKEGELLFKVAHHPGEARFFIGEEFSYDDLKQCKIKTRKRLNIKIDWASGVMHYETPSQRRQLFRTP